MKTCDTIHSKITYAGKDCPLCKHREMMGSVRDTLQAAISERNGEIAVLRAEIEGIQQKIAQCRDILTAIVPLRRGEGNR